MNTYDLKQVLFNIEKDNSILDNYNSFDLVKEAMKYIGDIDSVLRDDLVLTFIDTLISNKQISEEETKEIINICLHNIFYNIDEFDDSVFKRTFSMLVIASAINRHQNDSYLSIEELNLILNKVISAYISDHDLRGYIKEKGWAHGAAHGADVLVEFALLTETDANMMKNILNAIYQKANVGYYGYIHNEDDRMARAVFQVIKSSKLPNNYINEYIFSFVIERENNIEYIVKKNNIRNFLRSLYFRLIKDNENSEIGETILIVLEKL